ncbi:MAG: endonuclease/exonuclease/phosphatase family protein [Sphaerochaetaceae bacterium]|nr:endonuclease/exonuclease/phosphatase family protein [Sphaerochaetaceae bacterium]
MSSYPMRFSVMTQNLFNTELWEIRGESAKAFFTLYQPDILCLQEVRPQTLGELDKVLVGYERIQDSFIGWTEEGTIYFKSSLFSLAEKGEVDLDMPEVNRRLFWARLAVNGTGRTLFISTVHLTWQGNADEIRTGMPYRNREAKTAADALVHLIRPNEPGILCGDFNDPYHPARIISEVTGMTEIFYALGLQGPLTFPCAQVSEEIYLSESIDKMMFTPGPLRAVLAASPQYYYRHNAPSDHWSVEGVFELS